MADWDVVKKEPKSEWDVVDHTPIKQTQEDSSAVSPMRRYLEGGLHALVDPFIPRKSTWWDSTKPSYPSKEEIAKMTPEEKMKLAKLYQSGAFNNGILDKPAEALRGVGETALSQGLGLINTIQGTGRMLMGQTPQEAFDGPQYTPRTGAGEFINEKANDVINNLMAFGPGHIGPIAPSAARAEQIAANLKARRTPEVVSPPLSDNILNNLKAQKAAEEAKATTERTTNPGATAFDKIVESQISGAQSPLQPRPNGMQVVVDGLNLEQQRQADITAKQRQAQAQAVLEARQRALEQQVATQHSLDFNAAERARQEQASTGYAQHLWEQGQAEATQMLHEIQVLKQHEAIAADQMQRAQTHAEAVEAAARQAEAQRQIELRQKALEEQVARQTSLDQNAAERVRQEQAPTGHADWLANKAVTEAQQTHDFLKDRVQSEIDTTPHGEVPAQYGSTLEHGRIDENGIPIRADLSMEAQNLQNPLQRNLWGDELPGKTGDGSIPLTQALDSMPPGEARDVAVSNLSGQGKPTPFRGPRRGQGGGITPDMLIPKFVETAIKRAMDTLSNNMDRLTHQIFLRPKDATAYLRKVPGMGSDADKLVTRPTAAADMLEVARNQPDGPDFGPITRNTQSGLGMVAEKSPNVWVKNSAEWFAWSRRKGEYLMRNAVRPLESIMARLPNEELIALHKVFQTEMFDRAKYTPEQLKAAGMTPQMLRAYEGMRKNFDVALEEQNKQRRADKKPEIPPQEAYMASMFQGDYHIPVYNKGVDGKQGTMAWYIQVPTRKQAVQAIQWLKDNQHLHPNADVADLKYNHDTMYRPGRGFADSPREMLSAWTDLVDLLKHDPASQELAHSMQAWIETQGTKFNRQDLHQLDQKANVRGFMGDHPWLSDKENAHNWGQAQIRALENSVRWAPMQEALNNVKQYLSDPTIQTNNPNSVAITKAYMLQHLGVIDNVARKVENAIGGMIGRSSNATRAATGGLKKATYLATIAGSPGYWVATPLQAMSASFAYYASFVRDGSIVMGKGDFTRSMLDAMQAGTKEFKITDAHREALQWAHDNDVVSQSMFDPNRGLGDHPVLGAGMKVADWTMSRPDQLTRMHVFLPFADAFIASGKMTKEQAYMKAAQITDNIMVSMKRNDRPLWVDKMGSLGEAAYVFHAPVFNFYNHLSIFGRQAKAGNPIPLLTYLAATTAIGGVFALPLANELCDAFDWIKDGIAAHLPEHYSKVQHLDPRGAIYGMMPESSTIGQIISYGGASAATGVNMGTRFQNDLLDIRNPLKAFSPLGQEVKEAGEAVAGALHPNQDTLLNLLHAAAPGPLVRGLMESTIDRYKAGNGQDNGMGYTPMRNPNDVRNPDAVVNRRNDIIDTSGLLPKPGERGAKMLGVTALSEAQRRNKDFIANEENKRTQTALKNNFDGMWSAAFGNRPEEVNKYATAYIKLGGTSDSLSREISQRAEKLGMPPSQYAQVHANTLSKVLAVVRRKEMDK